MPQKLGAIMLRRSHWIAITTLLIARALKLLYVGKILSIRVEFIEALVAFIEIAIAIWLVTNFCVKAANFVGIILFVFLLAASLFRLVFQIECNCFGEFKVAPIISVFVVAGSLTGLLVRKIDVNTKLTNPRMIVIGMLVYFFCTVAIVKPARKLEAGFDLEPGQLVLLDPQSWLNKPIPFLEYVSDSNRILGTDPCVLVFFNNDCGKCRAYIGDYLTSSENVSETILIEVPPFSDAIRYNSIPVVRLDDKFNWFLELPYVVRLNNGVVEEVRRPK